MGTIQTKKHVRQRGLLKYQPLLVDEVYNVENQCPICHSTKKRLKIAAIQQNPVINYLKCPDCHGCSTSLMPTPAVLTKFYTGFYDDYEEEFTFDNPQRFAKHILQEIKLNTSSNIFRILDFGGGDGSLALAIADIILLQYPKKRIEIWLVDYQPTPSYEKGNISFHALKYLKEIPVHKKYDLLIASAILEHIPDLHTTFKELLSLAAPSGYFYARTPYRLPFKKFIPSLTMEYPGHVHDLGDSFWSRLPDTFNLNAKVITSRPSIVQYEFKRSFFLALAAYLAKFPAHVELFFNSHKKDLIWNYVGGWEILLQFDD